LETIDKKPGAAAKKSPAATGPIPPVRYPTFEKPAISG
jgi:hypothetical protein